MVSSDDTQFRLLDVIYVHDGSTLSYQYSLKVTQTYQYNCNHNFWHTFQQKRFSKQDILCSKIHIKKAFRNLVKEEKGFTNLQFEEQIDSSICVTHLKMSFDNIIIQWSRTVKRFLNLDFEMPMGCWLFPNKYQQEISV